MSFDFKNASKNDLRNEYERIAKETGDDKFFTRKELNHLPQVLSAGEQVLAFSSGFMDSHTWLIVLTDKRIIFLDKGMLFGLKQTAIELDKVNAVSGQTGIFLGEILIENGASTRIIKYVSKESVIAFTNKVRDAIEAKKHHVPTSAPHDSRNDDIVSKLERLTILLEKGALSKEEFDQQKAKILA